MIPRTWVSKYRIRHLVKPITTDPGKHGYIFSSDYGYVLIYTIDNLDSIIDKLPGAKISINEKTMMVEYDPNDGSDSIEYYPYTTVGMLKYLAHLINSF